MSGNGHGSCANNGTGNSGASTSNGPLLVRHGEHCACIWCLLGHRG